jgi:hypothetical protein
MTSVVGPPVRIGAGGLPVRALRGRAVGVITLACFALGWTGVGVTSLPGAVAASVAVAAAALSVLGVIGAVRVFRRLAADSVHATHSDADVRPGGSRLVAAVVGAEFVGVLLLARLLPLTGHGDIVPVAVCLVVGVHFFPLARLFEVPLYLRTAVALCAVAAATAPCAVLTDRAELWTLVPGAGAAVSLYVTCAALLRSCWTPHRASSLGLRSP